MQKDMYQRALDYRNSHIGRARNWEEFMAELNKKKIVLTPWCMGTECEEKVKKRSKEESLQAENTGEEVLTGAAKTLCLPMEQDPLPEGAVCFSCGGQAGKWALWGRSY